MFKKGRKHERGSKKWKELTDAVTFCLVKDMMPIYSVEKEGLRTMLRTFNSQYDLPGCKYFTNTAIPALHALTREKVIAVLWGVEFFAATTDLLSSHMTEPYISYTVHFVDHDWCLQSWCLQMLYLLNHHTANNLAEYITETLQVCGLNAAEQVCLTTDNGKNFVCVATVVLDGIICLALGTIYV